MNQQPSAPLAPGTAVKVMDSRNRFSAHGVPAIVVADAGGEHLEVKPVNHRRAIRVERRWVHVWKSKNQGRAS